MNSARGGNLTLVILSEAKDLLLIFHPGRSEAQPNAVGAASISCGTDTPVVHGLKFLSDQTP
jgi:hypothetical protein